MCATDEMAADSNSEPDESLNIVNGQLSVAISIGSLTHSFELRISPSTDVDLCGLQAWPCSILLIDWFVHELGPERLQHCSILELGSGPGLVAVALGPCTARYIASDADAAVLDLCRRNLARNRSPVSVVQFDLLQPPSSLSSFDADFVIAADLIYDDELTLAMAAAFADFLHRGVSASSGRVIIANESRLNFLIDKLRIGDASMDFFFQAIRQFGLRAVPIQCFDIPPSTDRSRSSSSLLFEIVVDQTASDPESRILPRTLN